MTSIRRHLSYANVVATMALVFAMGGSAVAAKHYLINSTNQIKPTVLKKLKGNTGKAGIAGTPGAPGKEGQAGKEGPQGKEGQQGKEGTPGNVFAVVASSGKLERGNGALSAGTKNTGTGQYEVQFNRNITQCAYVATIGPAGEGIEKGITDVALKESTSDSVFVDTYTQAGSQANKGFHLAVLC